MSAIPAIVFLAAVAGACGSIVLSWHLFFRKTGGKV